MVNTAIKTFFPEKSGFSLPQFLFFFHSHEHSHWAQHSHLTQKRGAPTYIFQTHRSKVVSVYYIGKKVVTVTDLNKSVFLCAVQLQQCRAKPGKPRQRPRIDVENAKREKKQGQILCIRCASHQQESEIRRYGQTDRRMDGRTDRLLEMRERI